MTVEVRGGQYVSTKTECTVEETTNKEITKYDRTERFNKGYAVIEHFSTGPVVLGAFTTEELATHYIKTLEWNERIQKRARELGLNVESLLGLEGTL